MKSVFVSYVYEDFQWVEKLRSWNNQGLLGQGLIITAERADVRQLGSSAINRELNEMISGAAVVLVLVGQDTHNRQWIDREIQLAVSKNKRVVVARIPMTTGGAPASVRHLQIYQLDPTGLRAVL